MVMKRRIRLSGLQKQIRLEGLISNDSPIAKALIGRSKDDEVEIVTPGGKMSVVILEIK